MPLKARRSAHERQQRDVRILASVRSGFSYAEIARAEALSHERVRQIVMHNLQNERKGTRVDPAMLQVARLEPALRLAAKGVANGELRAIGPLLKVMAHLDKYGAAANMRHLEGESVRRKLLARLDRMAARMKANGELEALTGPASDSEAENLDDAESSEEVPVTH
jgi:hypothetical protein